MNGLKIMSLALTVIGAVVGVASTVVSEKRQEEMIDNKVKDAVAEAMKEE